MLTLDVFRTAQQRIAPYVRRTPVMEVTANKVALPGEATVALKLEAFQVTGSFKARGAVNKLLSLPETQLARGIVTASGGNHGLGVAYAGWLAKVPATIYLSANVPPSKAEQLRGWGATIVHEGAVWDDANRAALAAAEHEGLAYFHPFADPDVIAGQGTLGVEIMAQLPDVDSVVVAIGGGGLISGISLAVKAINPRITVYGVEPVGAPTLYESVKAGYPVELAAISTAANTLAPRRSEAINVDIIRQNVDQIVLVDDDEMRESARWLWSEMGIGTEMSGAAALAALRSGKLPLPAGHKVCVLVCSSGTEGIPAR